MKSLSTVEMTQVSGGTFSQIIQRAEQGAVCGAVLVGAAAILSTPLVSAPTAAAFWVCKGALAGATLEALYEFGSATRDYFSQPCTASNSTEC